ncbi:hypothetical protein EDB86DRAFT_2828840 [Lactarius hatsudake]|nr:hypothetical protein EDB86DRAFT_2828840 [Lactarius hatsudake]
MVRKPTSELTANETSLLVIAARLISATKRVEDTPTTSEELKYMDARIDEEIVAIQKIFDTFKSGSKMPQVHPIIQAVGAEWKTATVTFSPSPDPRTPLAKTPDTVGRHMQVRFGKDGKTTTKIMHCIPTAKSHDPGHVIIQANKTYEKGPDELVPGPASTASCLMTQFADFQAGVQTSLDLYKSPPVPRTSLQDAARRTSGGTLHQLCETVRKEHPEWHVSLSSLTLDSYLDGLHPTRLWWLEGHPAAQKTSDDPPTAVVIPGPASPHPPSPPAHSHNTRGKGKRAVNAQVAYLPSAPSKPPYALRGTKRCADLDNPEGESNSTTPQKSDLPQVEVEQASPPRPTQRQRTEASATIAYEQDRCGPCALANEVECRAQSNSRSFSCVRCASKHKPCGKPGSTHRSREWRQWMQ